MPSLRKERNINNHKSRIYNIYQYAKNQGIPPQVLEVSMDIYDSVISHEVATLEYQPIEIFIGDDKVTLVPNGQFSDGTIRICRKKGAI